MLDHAPTPAKTVMLKPRARAGRIKFNHHHFYRDLCLAAETRQATTHLDDDDELS